MRCNNILPREKVKLDSQIRCLTHPDSKSDPIFYAILKTVAFSQEKEMKIKYMVALCRESKLSSD